MDKGTRNAIERATQRARKLLEDDFASQLEGTFDVLRAGTVAPKAGSHLSPRQVLQREKIVAAIKHKRAAGMSAVDAAADYLRDAAFTTLNRFVALKMLEARELVQECISKGEQSSGYREFYGLAPGVALLPDSAGYRLFIESLFDELSTEVKVLFSRRDAASLMWPKRVALEALLAVLNAPELSGVWGEDETIGWVYQYYNDEAERRKMRDESSAPRNSRELAVRNQFFTPRYVVEFLTDNTLGRLWYEMTRGETVLRDRCRYLVRRPTESFLKPGESAPENAAGTEASAGKSLSQEELLWQPVHIPHRPLKEPREILLLDPACGSMHFGLYAFDLFTVIYDEAWEIAHGPDDAAKSAETFASFVAFAATFPDKAAFLREVPRLIVELNIHGIDIDTRAAQIAGLSLWLRAQRAWHQAGVKPADRPRITRSNLVCAEPMPGEKELLHEFVEQQFPAGERPAFAFLLERIFDCMTLAGEAGSLLRIEEEIRTAIADAKRLWKEEPRHEQASLFSEPGEKEGQGEMRLDLSGITDEQFWERAEQRIYGALEAYAEQAEHGGGFQRRLFADDAAQGFAFIDLCRTRYDVAVMNPPFGLATEIVFEQLRRDAPDTFVELYASFVHRALELAPAGFVGAISSRGFFSMTRLTGWRRSDFVAKVRLVFDLGLNVMDNAFVASCSYILSNRATPAPILVLDAMSSDNRNGLGEAQNWNSPKLLADGKLFIRDRDHFRKIPETKFIYRATPELVGLFDRCPAFEGTGGEVRTGLTTFDDARFLRLAWEIPLTLAGEGKKWQYFSKGGDYAKYYTDIHLAINRADGGKELAEVNRKLNGQVAQSRQGSSYYYRPGLTFTSRSGRGFSVRAVPAGCVISHNAPTIYPASGIASGYVLGWINSRLMLELIEMQASADYFTPGSVKVLPWKTPAADAQRDVEHLVRGLAHRYGFLSSSNEISPNFVSVPAFDTSLSGTHAANEGKLIELKATISKLQASVSDAIDDIYRINSRTLKSELLESDPDADVPITLPSLADIADDLVSYLMGVVFGRWDIRYATGERPAPEFPDPFAPLPVCPPGMLQGDDGLLLSPEAGRQLRAEGRYPFDVAWDGILVDDPEHPLDLERRIHAVLAMIWGDRADVLEQEACALFGVWTLREWFRRPGGFFADHLKRYSRSRRQAPIYWSLSTASGSYSVWLYYHRFSKDTLYRTLEHVKEKLVHEEGKLARMASEAGATSTGRERREIATQEELVAELRTFHEEVTRAAPLWNPNLNDGAIINYGPLWRMIGHRPWQKAVKECWDELVSGDYDWAHLAMHLWPERVVPKCAADRSLAIAHGLEDVFWIEGADGKWTARKAPARPPEELVRERSSAAVKAALASLLGAPAASVNDRARGRRAASAAATKGGSR